MTTATTFTYHLRATVTDALPPESTAQLYGLMFYLEHPDQIEGWEPEAEVELGSKEWFEAVDEIPF